MKINQFPLTPARWRRLAPQLRAELRQVLGPPAGILNRPVLALAQELCAHGHEWLALRLYAALQGEPPPTPEPCGLGAMLRLEALMGETDPHECIGEHQAPRPRARGVERRGLSSCDGGVS